MQIMNTFLALGVNHQTPIDWRERLSIPADALPDALGNLTACLAIDEVFILSTCNRTEIYTVSTNEESFKALKAWLLHYKKIVAPDADVLQWYQYSNAQALRHLLQVACGLDSMVLGEPQVLGQLKQAYQTANQAGTIGPFFRRLFPYLVAATKRVRHCTQLGQHPVTFVYAALQLAERWFPQLQKTQCLLLGTGQVSVLVATHLQKLGCTLAIANRTLDDHARAFATRFQAKLWSLSQISSLLSHYDLIIAATASSTPVISRAQLETARMERKGRPIFIADLALPRDVEPEAAQLEGVHLYNLDHLEAILAANLSSRRKAAEAAHLLLEEEMPRLLQQMRIQNVAAPINAFRSRAKKICENELEKALKKLNNGADPKVVLASFGHRVTNKMLHQPTQHLRRMACRAEQQPQLLELVEELYS